MRFAAEKEMVHIGETHGAADHDMIHEGIPRHTSRWLNAPFPEL
jgi:hypothetical protein